MIRFIRWYRWHILFWSLYLAGWTFFATRTYRETPGQALLVTIAYSLGQGPLLYLLVYRWIPRLMKPRKTVHFIIRVVAGLAIGAGFTTIAVYLLLGNLLTMSWAALAGYTLLGNTYWVVLAVVVVTIRDRYRQEKQRSQTELRFLKSQMNPHFLFNALNSIYVLIRKDPDLAEHTLAGFSDMLRYQLYECASDHISVEREVTYLENFMRLEQLRKGDTLSVTYEKQKRFGHFTIAPLLIFPLVENAFKYVSSYPDKANEVGVRLSYIEPLFVLEVTNTIEPGATGEEGRPGGIGLDNLRRRLALLYPGRHQLHLQQTGNTYTATLQVQVI
jgi:sensor histidine kinase YesM